MLRCPPIGAVIALLLSFIPAAIAQQAPALGDLDNDGAATVRDIAIIAGHFSGAATLTETQRQYADVNKDGAINDADMDELVKEILGTRDPEVLPLATIRTTSPANGESDVAVTRETIVHFTVPLSPSATLDTTKFKAEFGGKKILSRVDISSDRKKATLFYLEPLPSNARVQLTLDGSGLTDLLNRPFDADGDGAAGGTWTGSFDTLSINPVAATAIVGRVFASQRGTGGGEVPLAGVTVTVDGAEQTLRATTDAQGNFSLSPCPAGSFFVHIDGRTSPQSSYPNGSYYPFVGKRWEAEAGHTDNICGNSQDAVRGTVYLPLITAGTMTTTSQVHDTKVVFPASVLAANPLLAGTEINVPANSLFADGGERGGRVGIAPVAPDRLPSPLPPGLNLPLVITIQTDGASNFDRPVPLSFPNLPDPITGQKLPPGAKSALWSFNHDIGDWEIVGPMTVTEDGLFVKTDAGVGVLQPGWHGTQPGTQGQGPGATGTPPIPPLPPCGPDFKEPKDENMARQMLGSTYQNAALRTLQILSRQAARVGSAVITAFGRPWKIKDVWETGSDIADGIRDYGNLSNRADAYGQYFRDMEIWRATQGEIGTKPPLPCSPPENLIPRGTSSVFQPDSMQDVQIAPNPVISDPGETLFAQSKATIALVIAHLSLQKDIQQIFEGKPQDYVPSPNERDTIKLRETQIDQLFGGVSVETFYRNQQVLLNSLLVKHRATLGEFNAETAYYSLLESVSGRIIGQGKTSLTGRLPSLVLPSGERLLVRFYFPSNGGVSESEFISGNSGSATIIPYFGLPISNDTSDTDSDGLSDQIESILGSNPMLRDTDNDGISDSAEIKQGTNPLDGLIVSTGVIASAPTSGHAVDVSALNNIAATANGAAGITLFNVLSGLNPVRSQEIDTPGTAVAVAIQGERIAVADYTAGLAIVDISSPANAAIVQQVNLGSPATCVTTYGPMACVGTANGTVTGVDLRTGAILWRVMSSAGEIVDLAVADQTLYVYRFGVVDAISLTSAVPSMAGSVPMTGSGSGRPRLAVGPGVLYASNFTGWNVLDIATNPLNPVLVAQRTTGQVGFKQLVSTGSSLALAAAGANSSAVDLDLYDAGVNGRGNSFLTTLVTPGSAEAVSIYNGLAYVADGDSGLQVVNYRAYDNLGIPPTISLSSNFNLAGGTAEEGALMRLTAQVGDDVQVRNVEFYVDGGLMVTDGNFPFEHRFVTPAIAPGKTTFTIRARATDTGGNSTWTNEITLTLVPDATPPQVTAFFPPNNMLTGAISELSVTFSEPMDVSSLSGGGLTLTSAGPDGIHGNADDVSVEGVSISFVPEAKTAYVSLSSPLAPGRYRLKAAAPAADAAGNAMASPASSSFKVFSYTDTDGDGVPDDWETELGLNPNKADSNNNGIPDGLEDFDNDGLRNAYEFVLNNDPRLRDTNGNGIDDGAEDVDGDGLKESQEFALGTDPRNADSDGDGYDDASEVADGTNPLSPTSRPVLDIRSSTITFLNAVGETLPPGVEAVTSPTVTFLNAAGETLPPDVEAVTSPLVVFLNAASTESPPEEAVSPQVIFRNNPPPP
jgi:hypothetical protein